MKVNLKKIINKIKIKREKTLYNKNMKLKKELKKLKEVNDQLKNINHQLIDLITIKNIKIRDLDLTNRYDK